MHLKKIENGIAMKTTDFGYVPQALDVDAFVGDGLAANVALSPVQIMMRQCRAHYFNRVELSGTVAAPIDRLKFFVPLSLIFPTLQELPDDGAVFIGLGQKIKMNIKTN